MLLLTGATIFKLGQLALKLFGAAVKAAHTGERSDLFNLAEETVEFAGGLTEAHRGPLPRTIAKVQMRLERGYQMMLDCEGSDWALREDVQAVFLRLADVLDATLPDTQAIVAANLDTARIAALVADMAANVDSQFAKDQIGRRILIELLTAAYDEVKQDRTFANALSLPIGQELLGRTERIEKQLYEITSKIGIETGVPLDLLNTILMRFGDHDPVREPTQVEARLRAKASEYIELRGRLNRLTADDPQVEALRRGAGELVSFGRFEEADSELMKAEQLDLKVARELEVHAERRFASAAASRAERASAARLRLDYRVAAVHFAEAASMVARDNAAAWDYVLKRAESLYRQGLEFGDNPALHEAIVVCHEALRYVPRDQVPVRWATTQMSLGNVLAILGAREGGIHLVEAVATYRAALQELASDPPTWALTQMNLGNALRTLGAGAGGTMLLEQAVAAYRAALTVRTRDRVLFDWAMTQMNLGIGLRTLGERESGTMRLQEAVTVLQEITRDQAASQWASVQINLGNALQTLGAREGGTTYLKKAVAVFRDLLRELRRDQAPIRWATIQMNLGAALQALGERESGTARLSEAVDACHAALQELTRDRAAAQWAATQMILGNALTILGEREGGVALLEQAVAAYEAALAVFVRLPAEYYADICRTNREKALALLSKRRG